MVENGRSAMARAGVPLLAMVKADAYGLGAVAIARALETIDPWGFGVATTDEGMALRDAGINRPIVVFTPILPDEIRGAHAARLTPTLSDPRVIAAWARSTRTAARAATATATSSPKVASWHLAIDTGMSRSGARWDAVDGLAAQLIDAPPTGACTHFLATSGDDDSIDRQLARFTSALDALPARPLVLHAENSLGIRRLDRRSSWSVVRPGIYLYGVSAPPANRAADAGAGERQPMVPQPVVALRARVVEVRTIRAGETVSYGGTFRAGEDRRIATVAAGYADGYRRAFSAVGHGLLHGRRIPVVGVVTMDMTMFDVTGVPCDVGDVVTLLGAEAAGGSGAPSEPVDLDSAARGANLLAYELLTGLRLRLPRVYVAPHAA